MLDLYSVINAPTDKLATAINGWSHAITKLEETKKKFEEQLIKPVVGSGWKGEAATAGTAFMKKVTSEVDDAIAEAKGIRKILTEANAKIKTAQTELARIVETEARNKRLYVDSHGKVYKVNDYEGSQTAEEAKKTQGEIDSMERRIKKYLTQATEADTDAAFALSANTGRDRYDFSGPKYDTLKEADKAHARQDARTFMELTANGHKTDNKDLSKAIALMKKNQHDPVFGAALATGWGAEKTLKFWTDMADPFTATPDPKRVNLLENLQESLGTTLASATRHNSPAMDAWEKEMIRLGPKQIVTEQAGSPWGFQVMSNLMRHGNYDSKFLNDYGNALLKTDKAHNKDAIPFWTNPANTSTYNYDGGNDRGNDPMTGFLKALGHNPEAATDFFKGKAADGPITDGSHIDADLEYLIKDRNWHSDAPLFGDGDRDKIAGYNELGHALEAATTGYPYNHEALNGGTADTSAGDRRTAETAAVMEQVAFLYGQDPALLHTQGGISDSLGKMAGAYIDDINHAVSGLGDGDQNDRETDFPAKYEGRAEFGRRGAIDFLSILGQDRVSHGLTSQAEHLYSLSMLDANPPTNKDNYEHARDAMLTEANVRGILDHSRVAQAESDYGAASEEANKELAKSTEWRKWGVGAAIGIGVASIPVPGAGAAGAAIIPVASETVGDFVNTYLGQEIDESAEKEEKDPIEQTQVARENFFSRGEDDIADSYYKYLTGSDEYRDKADEDNLAEELKGKYYGTAPNEDKYRGQAPYKED